MEGALPLTCARTHTIAPHPMKQRAGNNHVAPMGTTRVTGRHANGVRWCPPARRRYHAALYDALAGALLLARLAKEPALRDRPLAWILAHSTLDPEKRDAINQGNLF